jgi:glycosyltransferase involved in cell wall biosynthesis
VTVSVIVPAWNAQATLPRTLGALARQSFDEPYEVVVVDNGSDDGTARVLAAAGPGVRVVRRAHGLAGEARNDGVAAARGELLAFTDADCFPRSDWLASGARALRAGADLVQGRVVPDASAAMGPFDRSLWVGADDGLYQTANLFLRRSAFEAAGGFEDLIDDPLAAPFGEDVLLGWRVRRAGARTAFCSEAVVEHEVRRRGELGYVRDRVGAAGFPMLVARVPELRRTRLFAGVFLSRRGFEFDLAVLGAAAAAGRRTPWPLAFALPYSVTLARRALESGPRRAPLVAPVELAADVVTLAALLTASARHRTPVF